MAHAEVRIYATDTGTEPYVDWLEGLRDIQARARVRSRIARLQLGNFGDCKSVGGGVMELRIDHGPGYRVYLAKRGELLVLLLCGGDKRGQQRDIETAQKYLADWESR